MNPGTRLLIILYAAGLIALGAAPLRAKHGGISGYISKLSKELAGKELSLPELKLPKEIKVEVGDPTGVKETKELRSSSTRRQGKKIEVFDKHAPEDRSALDSLLDKVAR